MKNNYTTLTELMDSLHFDQTSMDYGVLEGHARALEHLASLGNMSGWIFDIHKRIFIHSSHDDLDLLGRDADGLGEVSDEVDFQAFVAARLKFYTYIMTLPPSRRKEYKLILSTRMLGVRYLSRQHVVELDGAGTPWLVMGLMELAPVQDPGRGFESSVINIKTGQKVALDTPVLTARQSEVLQQMKEGLTSKEIAAQLGISVHTVNIHRQNILSKTGAANAIEAIRLIDN